MKLYTLLQLYKLFHMHIGNKHLYKNWLCKKNWKILIVLLKEFKCGFNNKKSQLGVGAHTCNPSYLWSGDQDCGLRPALGKNSWDLYLNL
jgi:hypothetical protein